MRYDAKTVGKRVALIRKTVNPQKVKHAKDAPAMIEKWEDTVRRLVVEYKEVLTPGLKMGILLEMMPKDVTEALMTKLPDPKVSTGVDGQPCVYKETKDMILQLLEHKNDFGPVPMDCSPLLPGGNQAEQAWGEPQEQGENNDGEELHAFQKGGKSKGKGACWNCGQTGHQAHSCPHKGKGSGKDSGGKGKGAYFGGKCHNCGQVGHRAADCMAPRQSWAGSSQTAPGWKGSSKGKGYFGGGKGKGMYNMDPAPPNPLWQLQSKENGTWEDPAWNPGTFSLFHLRGEQQGGGK